MEHLIYFGKSVSGRQPRTGVSPLTAINAPIHILRGSMIFEGMLSVREANCKRVKIFVANRSCAVPLPSMGLVSLRIEQGSKSAN